MCKWCKWVLVWGLSLDSLLVVSLLICRWLFHCWWIFLRRWMFLGFEFGRMEEWFDWMRGMVGYWPKVFIRARVCALPYLGVLFFAVTSVTVNGIENTSSPKNNISFYLKQRIVLWKVTCRFIGNNLSFWGKQRVVLDWRSKSCFEDGVLGSFWGGVAAWKCEMLFLKSM